MGAITHKFPALEITALLRSPSIEFKNRYPRVKIVVGTFDDFEVIKKAALNADIVIRENFERLFLCPLSSVCHCFLVTLCSNADAFE